MLLQNNKKNNHLMDSQFEIFPKLMEKKYKHFLYFKLS